MEASGPIFIFQWKYGQKRTCAKTRESKLDLRRAETWLIFHGWDFVVCALCSVLGINKWPWAYSKMMTCFKLKFMMSGDLSQKQLHVYILLHKWRMSFVMRYNYYYFGYYHIYIINFLKLHKLFFRLFNGEKVFFLLTNIHWLCDCVFQK